MSVDPASADILFQQFMHLAPEDRARVFTKILNALELKAEVILCLFEFLPQPEKQRFIEAILDLVRKLRDAAFPVIHRAEFDSLFDTLVVPRIQEIRLSDKKARDRKSGPETIRQSVEICNLRTQDRRKWSLKKLAGKYGVTVRRITAILAEEDKWRRLAQDLEPKQEPTN